MNENAEKPKRKTHTSTEVKRRYNSKVYTRVFADLPKDLVAKFKETVKQNGTTTAAIFRKTIEQVHRRKRAQVSMDIMHR